MIIAVVLFIVVVCFELVFFSSDLMNKNAITFSLIVALALTSLYLFVKLPNLIVFSLLIISCYRLLNYFRLIKGRMHDRYLLATTSRTSHVLLASQSLILVIYGIFSLYSSYGFLMHLILLTILGAEVIFAILVFYSTRRNIRQTTPKPVEEGEYKNIPTISVCIPARNEDDDLIACLDAVVGSDYPKLEVLVLDDCSTNRRTPEIIRSYAQKGVVFVPGTAPPSYWLAKNWAYDQLVRVANGQLIVFCGVDVRLSKETLSKVVVTMQTEQAEMISVVPKLINISTNPFIQPMRYWWELALPRHLFKRPATLGSFWVIESATLKKLGGFKSCRRMIIPEAFFARGTASSNKYRFYRDNDVFGVDSNKPADEQASTAIRLRYPQLHKRPEVVLGFSALMFSLCIVPFGAVFIAWLFSYTAGITALVICILYILSYSRMIKSVRLTKSPSVTMMFPVSVGIDLLMLNTSMIKYEFGSVQWKGRDITIPVMHTTTSKTRSRRKA